MFCSEQISILFRTKADFFVRSQILEQKICSAFNLRYMSRLSERAALLKDLEHVLRLMMLFDDDTSVDFDEMMELYCLVAGNRYFNARTNIPKSLEFCNGIFDYPDESFRTIARCTKATFFRLMSLIQAHPIFNNNSKNKQAPVHIQLIIVLNRLGCDGNGASIDREALLFGKSFGTIEKYTDRVFTAILSMEKDFVYWPNAVERIRINFVHVIVIISIVNIDIIRNTWFH